MSFKDDPIYTLENVPLFETLYGKNLISLGSIDAIENMFSDIDLKGLKILDIGLGGVAFFLAKKYQIEIAGVEIHPWMAAYARTKSPTDIAHLLTFQTTEETYRYFLEKSGFKDIHFRDDSKIFLTYIKQFLNNLKNHQSFIEKTFGKEVFSDIWNNHQKLIDGIQHKIQFAIRIKATKK